MGWPSFFFNPESVLTLNATIASPLWIMGAHMVVAFERGWYFPSKVSSPSHDDALRVMKKSALRQRRWSMNTWSPLKSTHYRDSLAIWGFDATNPIHEGSQPQSDKVVAKLFLRLYFRESSKEMNEERVLYVRYISREALTKRPIMS